MSHYVINLIFPSHGESSGVLSWEYSSENLANIALSNAKKEFKDYKTNDMPFVEIELEHKLTVNPQITPKFRVECKERLIKHFEDSEK